MTASPAAESAADTGDCRFNMGLLYEVVKVLEAHGYKPPEPGPDGDESAVNRAYGASLSALYRLVRAFEGIEDAPKETNDG